MATTAPTPLRRLPTPHTEPPFDDDDPHLRRAPTSAPDWVQGSLALSMPAAVPEFTIPEPARRTPLRLVPDPHDTAETHEVPLTDDEPAQRPLPPVHRPWIARLAQALLEVLDGERPHSQLLPWTSDKVYTAVAKYAVDGARSRPNVDLTRHAPTFVTTIRVSRPVPKVAEVCALVQRGPRTQAVALRLEPWRNRWRCTAFELA